VDARLALLLREARGEPRAVDDLARRLGASAEAVRRGLAELESAGFRLERLPHRGVRLVAPPPSLLVEELLVGAEARRIGRRVRCVGTTTSTNDLAWASAERDGPAADGLAVFAEFQTAGRGRRGNRWVAPAHTAILCSVLLWEPADPAGPALWTRAAALAAAEAVEAETGLEVGIRWPNDLVVDDRKVAGVLVEARPGGGEGLPLVVGIGANATQRPEAFPAEIRDGVASLAMLLEGPPDRTLLARALLERLDAVSRRMAEGAAGIEAVRRRADARCRTLGKRIAVTDGSVVTCGEVVDLDPAYGLVLRLPDGSVRRFAPMTTHVLPSAGGGSGEK